MSTVHPPKTAQWQERFYSFRRALNRLGEPVSEIAGTGRLPEMVSPEMKDEVDRKFELTYELACQTLRDYFGYLGLPPVSTDEELVERMEVLALTNDLGGWQDMLDSVHRTIDTYSQRKSQIIFGRVIYSFYRLLKELEAELEKRLEQV